MKLFKTLKLPLILFALLLSISLTAVNTDAKDLGTYGKTWDIKEQNIVSYIKSQLTEEKMEEINKRFLSQAKASIKRPKSLDGIRMSSNDRRDEEINNKNISIHYFDPTITLKKDILDHKGNVIYHKGTRINPLDYQAFTRKLLFINGDNKKQVQYAINKHKEIGNDLKIILVKGSPIELMKQEQERVLKNNKSNKDSGDNSKNDSNNFVRFYFDQGGYLSKKFAIKQVPSFLKQEGRLIRVEEINIK